MLRELLDGQVLAPTELAAGAGITAGVGTVINATQTRTGKLRKTSIFIDLTGLSSSTTDLDIIGVGTVPAYLARITAALHGAPCTGRMICLEAPVGGVTDIDLYSATVGTADFDEGIAALTETAHVTAGEAWTAGLEKAFTLGVPADNYLYLTGGAAGTAAPYTAGKFLIELEGYDA
jgi:hypothetical protein